MNSDIFFSVGGWGESSPHQALLGFYLSVSDSVLERYLKPFMLLISTVVSPSFRYVRPLYHFARAGHARFSVCGSCIPSMLHCFTPQASCSPTAKSFDRTSMRFLNCTLPQPNSSPHAQPQDSIKSLDRFREGLVHNLGHPDTHAVMWLECFLRLSNRVLASHIGDH